MLHCIDPSTCSSMAGAGYRAQLLRVSASRQLNNDAAVKTEGPVPNYNSEPTRRKRKGSQREVGKKEVFILVCFLWALFLTLSPLLLLIRLAPVHLVYRCGNSTVGVMGMGTGAC